MKVRLNFYTFINALRNSGDFPLFCKINGVSSERVFDSLELRNHELIERSDQ